MIIFYKIFQLVYKTDRIVNDHSSSKDGKILIALRHHEFPLFGAKMRLEFPYVSNKVVVWKIGS